MRDQRFVAAHRGGPLTLEHHHQLAQWAADCADHVLPLFAVQHPEDDRPRNAIAAARAWARGEIRVGDARAASVAAHAAARDTTEGAAEEAARFVARAAGHAVATAHMADHAPGAAMYAIKARQATGDRAASAREHAWQMDQLPTELRELVASTFARKFASLGL